MSSRVGVALNCHSAVPNGIGLNQVTTEITKMCEIQLNVRCFLGINAKTAALTV